MPITYEKLFAMMKAKGLTSYKIRQEKIISESALQRLRSGTPVNIETIATLCKVLNCQPGDLLTYKDDEQ